MPRSFWSGSINFGLVHIPVKLYTATRQKDVRFRELHDKDAAPLRQKRICSADGEEVAYEHVVKGFEISKDHFVVIKPEELEALEKIDKKAPHAIDIEAFVDLNEIEPIYYEKTYYVMPDKNAAKPYALLVQAMREANMAAIARIRIRTKESVAALRVINNAVCLSTLFYADEVVGLDEFDDVLPDASRADKREIQLATQIISSMSREFDPSEYKDDFRERVLEMIERKADGETIQAPSGEKQPAAKVVDLMAALQASLAVAEQKTPARPRKKAEVKPAKARKTTTSKKRKAA